MADLVMEIEQTRREWHELAGENLPLNLESVFPKVEGYFAKRHNEKLAKKLAYIAPILMRALEPGERIDFATPAVLYNAMEFYFSGYTSSYTNRMAIIITDKRLLMIDINSKWQPRDIKRQIMRSEITKVSKNSFGLLSQFDLADGKKILFSGIRGADVKSIMAMFGEKQISDKSESSSIQNLCPSCLRLVNGQAGEVPLCPFEDCATPYRNARLAAIYSLIIPGIGDLYLRHFLFGAFEFIGSIFVLNFAIFLIILDPSSMQLAFAVGFLVILPRVIDYFVTRYMGRKGLVPLSIPTKYDRESEPYPHAYDSKTLPHFPHWVFLLFAVAALSIPATVSLSLVVQAGSELVMEAEEAAKEGDFERVDQLIQDIEDSSPDPASQQAKLAIELYLNGDLLGATSLVNKLRGKIIDAGTIDTLDAIIEEKHAALRKAHEDITIGHDLIYQGEMEKSWSAIDSALEFYRTIKRPIFPATRQEALLELAAILLGMPPNEKNYLLAVEVFSNIEKAPKPYLDLVKARIAIGEDGGEEEARNLMAGIDESTLPPIYLFLAAETRLMLGVDEIERKKMATMVAALPSLMISPYLHDEARQLALMAVGGLRGEGDQELFDLAADIAEKSNWAEATALLKPAE